MEIKRLWEQDVPQVQALLMDVVSRLPSDALYSTDRLEALYEYVEQKGEMYGVYQGDALVAYTVIAFPGFSASNLGREFGVPEAELPRVASLEGTIVHESVRGQGLQRRFHAWREQRAREKDMLYLYATVHPDNAVSRQNLEAAGLTLQFSRPMYGGLPRHCFAKKLF
ncbi:GNAT family N-acetyltransferase [Paenibacillus aceris]|uniref:GNAT superfamily N-acetyltransferase n=1 Tax=Paenibacillus aceris TaxID=869555 RepID=A0ABS4I7H5_9BACL|nr:GNAT family N-acetyltransferase [Paenibacillus aceris]MBP1966810.1 GNAT superfamily N-acetyltransferase [Paenibacillus aceris]NHW39436.1 GNAT family N-acetyltransferase [Paenibacillus aceris]